MRIIIPCLGLLLISFLSTAQLVSTEVLSAAKAKIEKGKALYNLSKYNEILKLTKEAYSVFVKDSIVYDSLIAEVFYLEGRVWYDKGDYKKAEHLVQKSLEIRKYTFGEYSNPVVKSLNVLGMISNRLGDYKKTESYYLKAWNILDSFALETDEAWVFLYINLGANYRDLDDIQKAILFYEKAIHANQIVYDQEPNFGLCITYINLGDSYDQITESEKAISNFKKAIEVYQNIKDAYSPYYLAHIHFCIGGSYLDMKKYKLGLQNLTTALSILNKLNEEHYWLKSKLNQLSGQANFGLGNLKESESFFNTSIEYLNKLPEINLETYYSTKLGLAKINQAKKDFAKSLSIYEEINKTISFSENEVSLDHILFPLATITEGLNTKVETLLDKYRHEKQVEDLKTAHATSLVAINILDSIKLSIKESESKQFLVDRFYSAYENAIEVNYLLFQLDKDSAYIKTAFQLSEKSKNIQLTEAVLQSKAEKFAGIPDELLEREDQFKTAITEKKKEKHKLEEAGKKNDSEALANINKELFDLKLEHTSLLESFEKDYPNYYNLKYAAHRANISDIQQNYLTEDRSIVEYFAGDKAIYVFVINKNEKHFLKLNNQSDFKQQVNDFYASLRHYDIREASRDSADLTYTTSAYRLYQYLIEPIAPYLQENIVIIPDGLLNYLPFAALLKTEPQNPSAFKTHDYLLKQYNISYNYSTTLLQEMSATQNQPAPNGLLAIAPSFLSPYRGVKLRSDQLFPLEHNEEEIECILQLCKGKALKSVEASKENFIKMASNYKAIHFATHGVANEKTGAYSYIAFTLDENTQGDENILFGIDIYNLNLNADMVVLSACETAAGELKRGEGVISTARAFSYAGARSLITTLWKVSDAKATEFMNGLYTQLQKKKPKDRALREATQAYLQANNDHLAHPFFWASFINIGSAEPVDLARPFAWWWALALLAAGVVGLGAWLLHRRKKNTPVRPDFSPDKATPDKKKEAPNTDQTMSGAPKVTP